MGNGFLETLKEVTIFMLAGQMLVHLLPTLEYKKYARVILGVMLLSRLALPILSLADSGAQTSFSEAFTQYEQEMERIGGQVSSMEFLEGNYAGDALVETVRQKLAPYAHDQGVRITEAMADGEGGLVVTVAEQEEEAADGRIVVRIEPIEVNPSEDKENSKIQDEDMERAEKAENLRILFADALQMETEKLEVIWDG